MSLKFSWDNLQEAPTPAKFDWESLPSSEDAVEPKTGAGQAALEHFGNAAAFGYLPQLQGVVSQIVPDPDAAVNAKLKSQGFNIDEPKDTYLSNRDATIQRLNQEAQDHPYASAAGTVAGAISGSGAVSALAPITAATNLGRLAQAAKGGAIVGAISNPGDTQGQVNEFQPEDRLKTAAGGAVLGTAAQGAIEGLTSAANGFTNIPASMQGTAEERALKSAGARIRDYRKAAGQDRIDELGRYMLDNGLVQPGMSVSDIAAAADKLNGQHGTEIESILKNLDEAGATAPTHEDMASAIEQIAAPMKDMKTAQPTFNALQDAADDIRTMGKNGGSTFQGAQDVKNFIADQVDNAGGFGAPNPSEKNLALRKVYGMVKDQMEQAAGKAAQGAGDDDLLKTYLNAKSGYRNSGDISKIAEDYALRQKANNFFSLGDKLTGAAGFVAGATQGDTLEERAKNAVMGASLGLANKAARSYGTPLVSTALDKTGAVLGKSGLPELGQMISPIVNAARKIPAGLATAEGVLSQPSAQPALQMGSARSTTQDRYPAAPASGPDAWASQGLSKLGIQDQGLARRVSQDPKGKQLLIQASDLAPNSKAMKQIMNQIQKGWGK